MKLSFFIYRWELRNGVSKSFASEYTYFIINHQTLRL